MVIEMKRRGPAIPEGAPEIRVVRQHLRTIQEILQNGASCQIQDCLPAFEEAVAELARVEQMVRESPHPERWRGLSGDIQELRSELRRVQALLAQGARFHLAWAQILGAAAGGYQHNGSVAALEVQPSLSFEG